MTRSKEDFLTFGAPLIGQAEIDEVVATLKSGWLGTGPRTKKFEQAFAAYKGVDPDCAVAVNSCTAALHLSLVASGLKPGDEVITTPMTFCATINAIIHAGGTPVLADVDPRTQNIDADSVREKLTDRTRAILPVHSAGRSCDMDALMPIVEERDLVLIEDCAHAVETTWKGKKAGTFGEYSCFSFYVTKNIITGEGGMALMKTPEEAQRVRQLSLHGMSRDAWKRFSSSGYKHYEVVEPGFKYNMMDLQAAIGLHQLERVDEMYARRKEIWARYQESLAGLPIELPAPDDEGSVHAYHLYTVGVDEETSGTSRDDFLMRMTQQYIGVGVHYVAMGDHRYYQERFGWKPEDTPHATRIGRTTASLPISPKMTDADVDDAVAAVKSSLGL
jgi:dTDP-4-amino-4,6-dideoxygalactose transaminase